MPAPIRCPLFVPATRPALIPKALASGADAVIVDIEDAVAEHKTEARDILAHFLAENPEARVHVCWLAGRPCSAPGPWAAA